MVFLVAEYNQKYLVSFKFVGSFLYSRKTKTTPIILTMGGRQKGSFPLATYSSGSKATNLLGMWSPYDGACTCVHQESEEAVWALGWARTASSLAGWTHLNIDFQFNKIFDGQVHVSMCTSRKRKSCMSPLHNTWSLQMCSSSKWSEVEPEYCSESFWSLLLMS